MCVSLSRPLPLSLSPSLSLQFWGACQLPSLALNLYEHEVTRLFDMADRDNNGVISYLEFRMLVLEIRKMLPAACTASQSRLSKWCKLLDLTTGKMVHVNKWTGMSPEHPPQKKKINNNHININTNTTADDEYQDPLPAAQYYRTEAESGNAEAQHELARCYSQGQCRSTGCAPRRGVAVLTYADVRSILMVLLAFKGNPEQCSLQ